jgi:hypothetical protein
MVATLVLDVVSWCFVAALTVVALVVTTVGAVRVYRAQKARGKSETLASALAAGTAVVLFLGGWLLVGLYWVAAWSWRMARHTSVD